MRASQIASITAASILTAGVGYAIYFDYKRQHDPQFRKQLKRESKKNSKAQKKDYEANKRKVQEAIDEVLRELSQPGAVPSDLVGRERYFNETIATGDTLLALGPAHHLAAAAAFFKAIKVYPSPVELIMIYQKAFPEPMVSLIMEMIARDAELGGADPSGAGFDQNSLAALAALAQAAPSSSLEEIDDDHTPTHLAATTAATAAGGETSSAGGIPEVASAASGPSSQASSQEWDKLSGASLGPSPPADTDADADVDVDGDAEDVTKSSVDTTTTTTTTTTTATPAYTSTDAPSSGPTNVPDNTETSSSSNKADPTSPFNFAAGSYAPSPVFKDGDKAQETQSEVVGEEEKTE